MQLIIYRMKLILPTKQYNFQIYHALCSAIFILNQSIQKLFVKKFYYHSTLIFFQLHYYLLNLEYFCKLY